MESALVSTDHLANARAAGLDPARLPRHLAVIMDGNGRWACSRGWERFNGHRRGAEVVRGITTECARLGIPRLTLYAFSSENWLRPRTEVEFLMSLLADFLHRELPTMQDNNIQLHAIGRVDELPESVLRELNAARQATAANTGTVLCLALSYGGRDELVDACRKLAEQAARGDIDPASIDRAAVQNALYAPQAPDVDVVIRTAGERRLSNFLPWQAAYAEYVDHPALWPDFTIADFRTCLLEYQGRERRFGTVPGCR